MPTTLRHGFIRRYLQDQTTPLQQQVQALADRYLAKHRQSLNEELARRTHDQRPLVLYCDLYPDSLEFVKTILERQPYQVSTVDNAGDMLAKVHILQPRIIITGMMVLGTCELAAPWIQANLQSARPIPILFMTAAPRTRLAGLVSPELPAHGYLPKPILPKDLYASLLRLLHLRHERRA
jgi:CheY-like chemotaxis protein